MCFSKIRITILSLLLSIGFAGTSFSAECIAPANPGGGWDFTCRTIGKIMFDIGVVDKRCKLPIWRAAEVA